MKKSLAFICAVLMIVSVFSANTASSLASVLSVSASAAANNGSCGNNVRYSFAPGTGVLTISGSGDMTDFSTTTASPFADNHSIKKVVIGNGVTSVGDNTFYNCSGISEISIPNTVKRIGEYSFGNCSSLKSISLPESISAICMGAFYSCANLKKITIPKSVEAIEAYAFGSCIELNEVVISSGVKAIEGYAFWYCSALESIVIPNSVEEVGENAFKKCSSLREVTLSKNTAQISDDMFRECSSITSVKIPEGVVSIGKNAFESCSLLSVVYIPKTVATINEDAFKNTALSVVYFGGSKIAWDKISKSNCFDTKYTVSYTSMPSEFQLPAPIVTVSNVASSGKIKLQWNKVGGAAKYKVYRSTSKDGTYKLIKTTTKTSLLNTSTVTGTRYYYKVRAVTAGGKAGFYSDPISRVCDCARPEITVSNDPETGKIVVSWKPVDGASLYRVYRSTHKDSVFEPIKTVIGTSFTNNDTVAGVRYYYKVIAISRDNEANSAYSLYKSRICDLEAPDVSIGLTKAGKPTLSWKPIDHAVSYKVYRSTSKNGTYKLLKTVKDKTTFTNTTINANTTYYYKVKAVHSNKNASSSYSSVVSIKTK